MPKQNVYLQSFSVGVIDRKKLVRTDQERMRLASENQTNLMCSVAGNMFLRPGTQYIGSTGDNDPVTISEFVFSADDAALLEFQAFQMRVYVNDQIITRPDVATVIDKPSFGSTGSWVLGATDGATATISSSQLTLTSAARGSKAYCTQYVPVGTGDRGIEHALRITVGRGPVTFRCGSTTGGDEYIAETQLGTGSHSLSFRPAGAFHLLFQTTDVNARRIVSECTIENPGVMTVTTPWGNAAIKVLRMAQSADVIFVASGQQQYKIERRGERSWSVVKYISNLGPFMADKSAPVRLKPSATEGNITLTASDNFFTADHVGAIFKLSHDGQHIQQSLGDDYTHTDPIKVTGGDGATQNTNDRDWTYTVAGTWVGTLKCFRSYDSENFGFKQYRKSNSNDSEAITANDTDVLQYDSDENIIVYYRIGFENTHTSGSADITINYDGGGGDGVCLITAVSDALTASAEVVKPFKNTTYTTEWREGMWSDNQKWPTAVALSEGRLFWAGDDKLWASVSDAYDVFDESTEGDSGPISRSIAIGGVNEVQWLLPLQRVVIGANGGEISAKSSGLDEPLTPTAFTLKSSSSIGSADVAACRVDGRGIFVDRTTKALFDLVFDGSSGDYFASELTRLCSSWFESGIASIAVSRRPDTRIWAVLNNGDCMCMVYAPEDKCVAFIPITTSPGGFERVAVLPGADQDNVYFIVRRTINNDTQRYIEKMATDAQAAPDTVARIMDSHVVGVNNPASAAISGLSHLRGQSVKVWADGEPITEVVDGLTVPKLFTVSAAGAINIGTAVTDYCVGLPYQGTYKSSRLAYASAGGTPMMQKQNVSSLGLIMSDYVRSGIRYGRYLNNADHPLYPLPALLEGESPDDVSFDTVVEEGEINFGGGWDSDARICMTVDWPANFLGVVFTIDTNG